MHAFINSVKNRLNLGIAFKAILKVLVVVSVILIIAGLVFILRGHAVAGSLYKLAALLIVLCSAALWFWQKKSTSEAAVYVDKFFGLKDSVNTAIHFEQSDVKPALKQLQYDYTQKQIEQLEAKEIPIPVSKKLAMWAGISSVIAVSLSFIPPSQEVLDQIAKEEATKERTAKLKASLEEEVEQLLSELTENEKALIDEDEVKKWIKDVKPTEKERDAMLNIARAKQNIQKQLTKLENRKNDALLKTAGIKLQKSSNLDVKATGDAMTQKNFDEIKQALETFKTRQQKNTAFPEEMNELNELRNKLKNEDGLTEEERKKLMKELAEKLEELRELTKRLAEAAEENQFGADNGQLGGMGDLGDLSDFPSDLPLDQLMELLDRFSQQMQSEFDGDLLDGEPMTLEDLLELLESLDEMDDGIGELQDEMDEMAARLRLKARLGKLKDLLEGRENRVIPLGLAGKKPGVGTDNTRRKERDPDIDNERYTKLKGQQGKGPVMKKTEAAESGFGVSKRKGSVKQRDFEHQMSSYMSRDDVPEDMKQAMRQYFKDIHSFEEAK